ncbi:cyclic nucleotide-binding domain-containing protein [bacterium]|nr:cyclic nucleotide-binding domain-containing protein [bacterium]
MSNEIFQLIKKSDWFRGLPDNVIERIQQGAKAIELQPDEYLIHMGDEGNSMFLILAGWVKIIVHDEKEGEIIVNHVGPGELVGEMSLIDQRPRSASVVTISAVKVIEFTRDDFFKLLEDYPQLGIHMISAMSNRMRFVLKYLESAVLWSQKIGEGDYSFLQDWENTQRQTGVVDHTRSDSVRANRFLSAFFRMAQGVQMREKVLKDELHKLNIQIDQVKRDMELNEITNTEFFEQLKANSKRLRKVRKKK